MAEESEDIDREAFHLKFLWILVMLFPMDLGKEVSGVMGSVRVKDRPEALLVQVVEMRKEPEPASTPP